MPYQPSVRLPPELMKRLEDAAQERMVSRNWLATRLLEEGLDRLIPLDEIRVLLSGGQES